MLVIQEAQILPDRILVKTRITTANDPIIRIELEVAISQNLLALDQVAHDQVVVDQVGLGAHQVQKAKAQVAEGEGTRLTIQQKRT